MTLRGSVQVWTGVAASAFAAWVLDVTGLVTAEGAPMTPLRAVAMVLILAVIPIAMGLAGRGISSPPRPPRPGEDGGERG
jgi:hypothetical protein